MTLYFPVNYWHTNQSSDKRAPTFLCHHCNSYKAGKRFRVLILVFLFQNWRQIMSTWFSKRIFWMIHSFQRLLSCFIPSAFIFPQLDWEMIGLKQCFSTSITFKMCGLLEFPSWKKKNVSLVLESISHFLIFNFCFYSWFYSSYICYTQVYMKIIFLYLSFIHWFVTVKDALIDEIIKQLQLSGKKAWK